MEIVKRLPSEEEIFDIIDKYILHGAERYELKGSIAEVVETLHKRIRSKNMKLKDEEILKRAIEKAIKGGWREGKEIMLDDILRIPNYYTSWDVVVTIIFSHSFAKAFWGEEKGINKVDFIYVRPYLDTCYSAKMTIEEFLNHFSRKQLNLLLDRNPHRIGKNVYKGEVTYYKIKEGYKYHLQQISLVEDKLKYLEKFL